MKDILTVYHGSKSGLEGSIRMVAGRNRQTCDFGQGFDMAAFVPAFMRSRAAALIDSCELAIENLTEDAKAA